MIPTIIFGFVERISVFIFGLIGIGVLWLVFINIWGCVLLGLGGLGLVLCLKKIPAEPPSLGVVIFWGERIKKKIVRRGKVVEIGKIKKEGWRFLAPFFPFLYDVIIVNVTKQNYDLPAETVRTPDLAVLEIPISLTWTPNKDYLIEYLNCGGKEGVNNILADIVRERVRGWAMNHQEGPQTFQQALGAREDAVEILIKAVAGTEMKKIPSYVPTTILFKYFNEPQIPPNDHEKIEWGEEWKDVKEILESESENKIKVKKAVKIRREQVKEIQRGNGVQAIPQLGITLNRLNIGDIAIKKGSQLEKVAEKEVSEMREKSAEIVELEHVRNRIKEIKEMGFSLQEARDIVQTERNKVNKQIYDIQGLEGFGQGIGKMLSLGRR